MVARKEHYWVVPIQQLQIKAESNKTPTAEKCNNNASNCSGFQSILNRYISTHAEQYRNKHDDCLVFFRQFLYLFILSLFFVAYLPLEYHYLTMIDKGFTEVMNINLLYFCLRSVQVVVERLAPLCHLVYVRLISRASVKQAKGV
jgi:hypothetical protein